nr:formylglycine-generating enzyme family protein [Bacteriovorax sp. HI3]
MNTIKYCLFSCLFIATFFSQIAKSDELCALELKGKNANLTMCEGKKAHSKLKSVLITQLSHALILPSEFEAIIKRNNPIYRPDHKGYRMGLADLQWLNAREALERVRIFATNTNLTATDLKAWSEQQKDFQAGIDARKDFPVWRKKFNTAVEKLIQDFSKKENITFTKTQISANAILRDILSTEYWSEKKQWKAEWVKIPKGKNILGSNKLQPGYFPDEAEFTYENKSEFTLQASPVTQMQWTQIMGSNPSRFKQRFFCPESIQIFGSVEMCPDNPVENISANDVQDFITILALTFPELKTRLPDQNEWEFAARGQAQTIFWFGSNFDDVAKNCWEEIGAKGQTHPVKSKPLNPFGLSDTCGNVWQLTKNKNGYSLKGGSWTGGPRILRPATKTGIAADGRFINVGFRLIKE